MNRVINDDANQEHDRQRTGGFVEQNQDRGAGPQPAETPTPDFIERDRAGRNGPFLAVLPVEFDMERVVQKHAAQEEAARAKAEHQEYPPGPAATEQPARQAI